MQFMYSENKGADPLRGYRSHVFVLSCCGSNIYYMSRVMNKPAFCICENKDAAQLHSNRAASFRYIDSTIIRNFKPLAIFCGCTAWFVLDLVGNTEDRFFHVTAQIY